MGFKMPWRTARLVFEEGSLYAGAEVRMRLDVPMADYIESLRALYQGGIMLSPSDPRVVEQNVLFLAKMIIDWNLTDDDGNPLPVTTDVLRAQPPKFINDLTDLWRAQQPLAPAGALPLGA